MTKYDPMLIEHTPTNHLTSYRVLKYWLRGDILQNRSEIEKNKYIRKYIVGHRDDKEKPVAKVFLSRDDEDAKELFKSCCKNRDNIEFEFILQSKEEGDEIVSEKTNTKTLNTEERKELRKFVRSNTNKIFATYSTVVLVSASTDCILICCLDKTLIPFGEKKLPEFLEGWPCDVREGIPLLNISCNNCKASKPNSVEAGCSIGIPSTVNSGSVGFFVEPRKKMHTFECGFLTACHVAINDFDKLYQYNELLSESPLGENKHVIVHPSTGDNNIIGEVFESFIGNFGLSGTGLDLAVVKTYSSPEKGEKETLDVIKEDDLDFGEYITVKKCGNTTGTTFGYLSDCALSVRVNSPLSSNMLLKFDNCYAVKNIDVPFFKEGDSGAGVFVVQNDGTLKPLGIAFSSLGPMTIVCKIDDFLDKLDLQIVRYEENTTESMESV
uniref:Uncharacterized protein n=1 Tax=Magallana gigas TaxID=29159 RepID=A0A8W8NUK1_MAGGI